MDTPIMLLFFNRPDTLKETFNWIRKVKPKQLFLVQDGPRPGNNQDLEKIYQCREIVESVDWECQVQKNYSDKNLTCDVREYSGIDWCFRFVDRLLILEDDCVPADTFYDFCSELLERYKNDNRIGMISGFVRCGTIESAEYDYVFSNTCAGCGWATWKRAWDEAVKIRRLEISEFERLVRKHKSTIENYCLSYKDYAEKAIALRKLESEKCELISWENIWGLSMIFNNQLAISPRHNMIKYAGICKDATHSADSTALLPRTVRQMFTQPAVDVSFPLKHPEYIVRDFEYEKNDYKQYFGQSSIKNHLESCALKIRHGRFDLLLKSLFRKIRG